MSENSNLAERVDALEKAAVGRRGSPFSGWWPVALLALVTLLTVNLWLIYQTQLTRQQATLEHRFWVVGHGAYPARERAEAFLALVAFGNREWRGACLDGLDLTGAKLSQSDLSEADFKNSLLARATLVSARLYRAKFHQADLTDAILDGADLSSADLFQAVLRRVNLPRAHLRGANLHQVDAMEANLAAAQLTDAYLVMINLSRAGLAGADLSGANLEGAILKGANVSLARMAGVLLKDADLTDCNWWRARGFSLDQLEWLESKFPPSEKAPTALREDYLAWQKSQGGEKVKE
jgi:uncharacterized protein YjbI with pentapeptide repeats